MANRVLKGNKIPVNLTQLFKRNGSTTKFSTNLQESKKIVLGEKSDLIFKREEKYGNID